MFYLTGATGGLGRTFLELFSATLPISVLRRCNSPPHYIVDDIHASSVSFNQDVLIHVGSATPSNIDCANSLSYDVNIIILLKLLESFASISKKPDVVFISSTSIYSVQEEDILVDELYPAKALAGYGLSKLKCEVILENALREGKLNSYISLRLPGLLSPKKFGGSGSFLSSVVSDFQFNKVVNISNPHCLFNNTIDAFSVCNFIVSIINLGLPNTAINLASYPPVQICDIIYYISNSLGVNPKISLRNSEKVCFQIDVRKSMIYGFTPPSVYDVVDYYLH